MAKIFISLEGPDGAGKSTVAAQLQKKLQEQSTQPVLLTREPGGSKISEQIRQVILDVANQEMDARTEALLYAASRRQHAVEVVAPALAKEQIVLSDRYLDSSIAYQGAGREIGIAAVRQLNLFAVEEILPSLTLYLDLPPALGLKRIQEQRSQAPDRLEQEQLAFHERVYQAYNQLVAEEPQRFVRIDATQELPQVVAACWQAIAQRFFTATSND
ncbi:dTMP kinase [Lactobacillus sp. DCY120]|uniref:Thymidylate kinase n=1 Tax=Bombilactobacillus apium TaxID=2675299 RepID=A0A850QW06_9LACO|nr:dTMP kinase [Bombilactobacillus apium]NVY95974.1 dTMP kinase [Bombilactobacillus apium]